LATTVATARRETRLAVELVLGRVGPGRLLEDLLGDLLIAARRMMGRGRCNLGAVDGDDPDLHQPRPRAQLKHPAKQVGDRLLVAGPEAGDRGVIGDLVAVITRKATSSRQRRSIPRADRTPIAYA
jgi:hypothetical protein